MDIKFFDDPLEQPRGREDTRFRQIGLFVYPERRVFAFGVELTPFVEQKLPHAHGLQDISRTGTWLCPSTELSSGQFDKPDPALRPCVAARSARAR